MRAKGGIADKLARHNATKEGARQGRRPGLVWAVLAVRALVRALVQAVRASEVPVLVWVWVGIITILQ